MTETKSISEIRAENKTEAEIPQNAGVLLKADAVRRDYLRAAKGTNIFTAVHETTLSLRGGEVTVLKGRSGSGKTTLLQMLAGLLQPTKGSVIFFAPEGTDLRTEERTAAQDRTRESADAGDATAPEDCLLTAAAHDLYACDDEARSRLRNLYFGYIPQGAAAIGSLTVTENILLPYSLEGLVPEDATRRAQSLMRRLSIDHLAGEYPGVLSGGELRRLSIARALIRHPLLLFADEPTGDLDDESTQKVFVLFRETARAGTAVLIVSHETDAEQYADHVLRMHEGRVE